MQASPASAASTASSNQALRASSLRFWILFFALGGAVAALDLWSKETAFKALGVGIRQGQEGRPVMVPLEPGRPRHIVIIPNWFDLEANINYGAFSGWGAKHTGFLALISLVALFGIAAVLFFYFRRAKRIAYSFVIALALLWGGTLGNFYDRAFIGAVRDFIKWFYVWDGKEHVWPNFNLADSSICIGVGLLLLREFCRGKKPEKPKT